MYIFFINVSIEKWNISFLRLAMKNQSLEDFDYSRKDIMQEIYSAMNSTNFVGVSVSWHYTVKCCYNAVFGVQEIDRVIAVTAL